MYNRNYRTAPQQNKSKERSSGLYLTEFKSLNSLRLIVKLTMIVPALCCAIVLRRELYNVHQQTLLLFVSFRTVGL